MRGWLAASLVLVGTLLASIVSGLALAQASPSVTIEQAAAVGGVVLTGGITGDQTATYLVSGEAGQTLSVDILSTNAGLFFNILPEASEEALFVGSTSGAVADIPLAAAGTYVVQVYLMRNAARRNEAAQYSLGVGLSGPGFADGLAGGPDGWQVAGLDQSALNIRNGPDKRYGVIGKARNGDEMQNRGCRMTGQTRWCSIRMAGSGMQGWVDGRYLVEAAAPVTPEPAEGDPKGNGVAFDATGMLDCAAAAGATIGQCRFGVVRDGPGNAGVWIALADGTERAILFEGGVPVSANSAGPFSFTKDADLFSISVGTETYRFPEAVISGG